MTRYTRNRIAVLACCLLGALATASAQPSWSKKAAKSVFALKTFTADGTLHGESTGFFVGDKGQAVSSLAPFKGAARAVVIDAAGKEWPVSCMLGANDTYDVAKFQVGVKKCQPLPLAAHAAVGSTAWLLPYRAARQLPTGTIRKTEQVMSRYDYYTIAMPVPAQSVGCPLMNEAGEVIGLMQQSAAATDTLAYAVSALMADSLRITGLSLNDPALRATAIRKALPDQQEQAVLMLYIASSSLDSASYVSLLDDFIARYPSAVDGYVYRAQLATGDADFAAAQKDMEQALRLADKKDEAHFNYSKLIYQKLLYMADKPYEPWTLDKALDEARQAYRLNPLPAYRHHEAQLLFAQKKYDEAYDVYQELQTTNLAGADIFYEASRCKEMAGDTLAQLALLDSAVAQFSKPYLKEAAPYLWARSQARFEAGQFRDAVADMNDYEQLMAAQVNANFYYVRFQAEVSARLFQQALNDIGRAIQMQPEYDLYYAEKASLEVRVGQFDEAIATAQECVRLAPQYSDGYLFLGLAQCLKGQKADGLKNLQRARELGDPQADELIEKYGK